MKIKKFKVLNLLLCLFVTCSLITGCMTGLNIHKEESTTHSEPPPSDYASDDEEKLLTQEAFNEFLDGLFEEIISESTFSLRLRLKNPEAYGIDNVDVKIDSFSSTYFEDYAAKCTAWLETMASFNYDFLTGDQQYTYDILEGSFENELFLCKNSIYYEPLSPISGIQNQLPVLFSELPMDSEAAIIECIELLNTIPEYFSIIIDFETQKGKNHCFMSANAASEVIAQCTELSSKDGFGFLCDHFAEKINSMEALTDRQKTDYIEQITSAVTLNFIQGYSYLVDELSIIEATYGNNECGLSLNDNSRTYYEALVEGYTGSGKSVNELISMTDAAIADDISRMQTLLLADSSALDKLADYTMPYEDDPEAALKYLAEQIETVFPNAPVTTFNVLTVDEAMEDMLSPAFYLLPAVDDTNNNNIYINYSEEFSNMDLFPTLAHEGFPGHLYQTTYFASTNPHPIRQIISPIGYSEGWAKYAEIYSYNFTGLDEITAGLLAIDQSFGFALYSRADMGIHSEGWDLQDVRKFFSSYGITDSDVISEIYYTVLDNPGIYLQYYIGYLEIMEMRKEAQSVLGEEFSIYSFHKFILDCGPSQFYLINEEFDKWLSMTTMK